MSPVIQNILWCVAGIAGVIVVVKLFKKTPPDPVPPVSPTNVSESNGSIAPKVKVEAQSKTAKQAFLENVEKFRDILPQLNDSLNVESWSEQIVDINNAQLTALWKRCLKDTAVWKQMLSSWGLRQDTCKTFTYLEKYANMYDTADKSEPEVGSRYRVIDGCWILTDNNSGDKRVIKKGIIEKL